MKKTFIVLICLMIIVGSLLFAQTPPDTTTGITAPKTTQDTGNIWKDLGNAAKRIFKDPLLDFLAIAISGGLWKFLKINVSAAKIRQWEDIVLGLIFQEDNRSPKAAGSVKLQRVVTKTKQVIPRKEISKMEAIYESVETFVESVFANKAQLLVKHNSK